MGFEGNECQKLLKNVDTLETILVEEGREAEGKPFVDVFKAFVMINTEYSREMVDISTLEKCVQTFRDAWILSGMALIPKVHIILDYLIPFVIHHGGKWMERFAEQAHESLHAEDTNISKNIA